MPTSLLSACAAAITAAALFAWPQPFTAAADPVAPTAVVLKVVDGDTIDIRDDVRGRLRVRILGIDTPETKKPGYSVGCWGPEATAFAEQTMLGQRVALVTDPMQDRTDSYGRTLAYLVKPDGWDYSVEAARAGAARSYVYGGNPASRYDAIAAAEAEARDAQRGLWGPPCYGNTASTASTQPAALPAAGIPPARVYYGDCAAARAVGAAPLLRGQPGYRSGLDRDGDGAACES